MQYPLRGLFALAASLAVSQSAGAFEVPAIRGPVNDLAGMLDETDRSRLESMLSANENARGDAFALVTLPSLEGEVITDVAARLLEGWKVGNEGHERRLVLVIAAAEREVRIEAGLGLDGAITDAVAAHIIDTKIRPAWERGDLASGIQQAFAACMGASDDADESWTEGDEQNGDSVVDPSVIAFTEVALACVLFCLALRWLGRIDGSVWGARDVSETGAATPRYASSPRRSGYAGGRGSSGSFGGGEASGGW